MKLVICGYRHVKNNWEKSKTTLILKGLLER